MRFGKRTREQSPQKKDERRTVGLFDPFSAAPSSSTAKVVPEYDITNVKITELTFRYVPSVEAFDALLRLSLEITNPRLCLVLSAQMSQEVTVDYYVASGRHINSYVKVKVVDAPELSATEFFRNIARAIDAEIIAVDTAYRCGKIVKALEEPEPTKKGKK
jgi:hypothetical protein